MGTAQKTPIQKEFWVCPLCGFENWIDLDELARSGIPHLETRLPNVNVCTKCVRTIPGNTIKVVGKKWGHDPVK